MTKNTKSKKEFVKKIKESISEERAKQIEDYANWYKEKKDLYEDLSDKVAVTLEEILIDENIDYSYIEYRVKKQKSFEQKLKDGIVHDGKSMQDLAGIRVISYILPDVEKISKILSENFEIIDELSKDKSEILGEDKVGYHSVHFVCRLSKDRLKLHEFRKFKGMVFEIQVRTILQHAWAQIEHEKKYKFTGKLPKGIPRRFNLIAGILELADNEFQQISKLINEYSEEVKNQTKKGKLDIEINPTSLTIYLLEKFGNEPGIYTNFTELRRTDNALKFLSFFNIETLDALDKIIPKNFIQVFRDKAYKPDFADIVIDAIYIKFEEKIFEHVKNSDWTYSSEEAGVLGHFGFDITKLKID